MPRTVNYSWRPYGDPYGEPACKMVAYFTDPEHEPTQWQEELEGEEKDAAMAVIESDRAQDEPTGYYTQHTINAEMRLYQRQSSRTGNSWEVQLEESGRPFRDPCTGYVPPLTPPPRIPETTLSNATVKVERLGKRLRFTIEGNLPEA